MTHQELVWQISRKLLLKETNRELHSEHSIVSLVRFFSVFGLEELEGIATQYGVEL